MSGRPVSKHVGVVEYRMGRTATSRGLLTKRVGWFGKCMAVSMTLGLFGFALGMRESLLDSINLQYSQTTIDDGQVKKRPSAVPDAAKLATNIVDLQPTLNKWVFAHQDQRWSIVAKSLEGPQFDVSINADMLYDTASIYKLFMTIPLYDQVPVKRQGQTYLDAGGARMTIKKCVDLMVRLSDNECGEALGYFVNWSKAEPLLLASGFRQTTFKSAQGASQTSAADTARFLEQLNGGLLPSEARDEILKSMNEQVFRRGMPAGCPGCSVADRVDNIGNMLHDAGIVSYSRGKYILVVFSENSRDYDDIAKLTGQIHQKILDTIK